MANIDKTIHNFWESVDSKSDAYRGNPSFESMEDQFISNILKKIKKGNLLDVGCGKGDRTERFAKMIQGKVTGIDYTDNMINQAKKRETKNLKFIKTSIFDFEPEEKYDVITSCRCIINTITDKGQLKFVTRLHDLLKPGGHLIIMERSKQGLERFNNLRNSFKLPKIKERYHNHYINEDVMMPFIIKKFDILETQRFGTFFFTLRFLKPLFFDRVDGIESQEQSKLCEAIQNTLGSKLDEYGMQLLLDLKKKTHLKHTRKSKKQ